MHSQLENYLAEVSSHLDPLPPARRNEELMEMRQHLNNAIFLNAKSSDTLKKRRLQTH